MSTAGSILGARGGRGTLPAWLSVWSFMEQVGTLDDLERAKKRSMCQRVEASALRRVVWALGHKDRRSGRG